METLLVLIEVITVKDIKLTSENWSL